MTLRLFSKITCFSTLFLIFAGGMVTSTGSGLAVPDWPLSYGTLFPPMVGGIFYEHGHRMIATLVGFLTLCLAVWLKFSEQRKWVRLLGYWALAAVICQGLLGGITVLFFLPTPVSVSHAVLAQTFFCLTIFLAYSQSKERELALHQHRHPAPGFLKIVICFFLVVYIQLILGAIMRHTHSGLAIPDFPKMAGSWIPTFDQDMLFTVNDWRFENNLDYVQMHQIVYHFIHRVGALIILIAVCFLNWTALKYRRSNRKIWMTLMWINGLIFIQIILGITTVLTMRSPVITSLHVAIGAAILGMSTLLLLRTAPVTWSQFTTNFNA